MGTLHISARDHVWPIWLYFDINTAHALHPRRNAAKCTHARVNGYTCLHPFPGNRAAMHCCVLRVLGNGPDSALLRRVYFKCS